MKRTLLALALALVAGGTAHFAWFAAHRPPPVDDLDSQLRWMKRDLRLDDGQLARIRALHAEADRSFADLTAQVAALRRELAEFELQRRGGDAVDFVAFARFVDRQRELDRACADSTRKLVDATAGVLRADQRAQYLGLFAPVASPAGRTLLN